MVEMAATALTGAVLEFMSVLAATFNSVIRKVWREIQLFSFSALLACAGSLILVKSFLPNMIVIIPEVICRSNDMMRTTWIATRFVGGWSMPG